MRERDSGLAQDRSGVSVRLGFFAFVLLAARLGAAADGAPKPGVFLMGVWPDRILYFDEKTETFVGEFRLKHGAATREAHTPDFRRFYFITDRMEAVEVVDPVQRVVVDEVKLSTESRKVRLFGVTPDPTGKLLYLDAHAVRFETDRFVSEPPQYVVYDLETHKVKTTFELPKEIPRAWGGIRVSPDGNWLYVMGQDIYILSTTDYKVTDKIVLSKPIYAGYGPLRGGGLEEDEPGIFFGIYRTTDPYLKKSMFGVVRLDLREPASRSLESFELGPEAQVGRLALTRDKKLGYAGLNDLVVVDMEQKLVLRRKENFEQGRTNNSMIVSADGKKLYVSGVGDTIWIYNTATLERIKSIFAGGDFMVTPLLVPRSVLEGGAAPTK